MSLDIYSYPSLEIPAIEYHPEGESKVKENLRVALDFGGDLTMTVVGILAVGEVIGPVGVVIGSLVGLASYGISAGYHYFQEQELLPFDTVIDETHHKELEYHDGRCTGGSLGFNWDDPSKQPSGSNNDLVFFKLDPKVGKTCGLTKIVLKGDVEIFAGWSDLFTIWPVGTIEIALSIPWFLRG
jgi:hypothetical protein